MDGEKKVKRRPASEAAGRKHENRPRDKTAAREELAGRLDALERSVSELTRQLRIVTPATLRIQRGTEAVVRKLYMPDDLGYPHRLTAARFGLLSQHQEDGITWAILNEAGIATRRFAELGCGHNGGNSGFFASELGWTGLMVDADRELVAEARQRFPRADVIEAWMTRETINELLTDHGITGEVDLLSIDIDGNDYWLWEAIDTCSPRVVIMECNMLFGPDRAVVVPYAADFDRHDNKPSYFGASLAALTRLAVRKGYRLVATETLGPNAYFLREDLAPHIPAQRPADLWRVPPKIVEKRRIRRDEIGDPVAEIYDYIETQNLPLVDLDG